MLRFQVFRFTSMLYFLQLVAASGSMTNLGFDGIRTITSDVCIIGGGSSGTYTAIRLLQSGKSVTVVEKESVLGGHTNTYIDPITHAPINYGVIIWENFPVVQKYLASLNITVVTTDTASSPFSTDVVDFESGTVIPSSAIPRGNLSAALQAYVSVLESYPYLVTGFNLPSPVPPELLLPFRDVIEEYNLGDLAYTAWLYNQGIGNILAQPLLYVLKYFGLPVVQGIVSGFLVPASRDNHQLYDNALATLGSSALLSTNVLTVQRHKHGVNVLLAEPSGSTLVRAKKLVIAIPPKPENLGFLDLDWQDRQLLRQFNNSHYWNGVIRNSGIPDNTSLNYVDVSGPYGIPNLPGIYAVQATGVPRLHSVYYGSPFDIPAEQVRANILSDIAKVVKAAAYPPVPDAPVFVAFHDHSPFELTVSTEAVSAGFYEKLNGLQGKNHTWWTGAAWQTQDSSLIWNFTEYNILPHLLE